MYMYMYIYQTFIEAILSTAVFPRRFSFFTICLVRWKMRFYWIFLGILEFDGEFWKVAEKDTNNFPLRVFVRKLFEI